MWTCPKCKQEFVARNAVHSCNDRSLDDFLEGKSEKTVMLFNILVDRYLSMGDIKLHPAKWRIAFASRIRFAYIHRLGKNYVDLVIQLDRVADDNLCFYKIAGPPGSDIYNHYFRMEEPEDLNDEVIRYMREAYDRGKKN